jgi:orotidine-5'-phosphate decarboxylase
MKEHFADKLCRAIADKEAPVCVGLDPVVDRLPDDILKEHGLSRSASGHIPANASSRSICAAISEYGRALIETVAPLVPAIKINIAFFEPFRADGLTIYFELVAAAQQVGLLVIGDAKRADIGHTSGRYALAHLGDAASGSGVSSDSATPDALTVNPYFGWDGVKPFVELAGETGRGVFVLVQTSNASAEEVQGLVLSDGLTVCQRVAVLVQGWAGGDGCVGKSGYSCVGAVVSPRDLPSTERIRTLMPQCIFLVPGFGAQGRTADEVARCFKEDGTGAIVAASRSVLYAYESERYRHLLASGWRSCVARACKDFVSDVRAVAAPACR